MTPKILAPSLGGFVLAAFAASSALAAAAVPAKSGQAQFIETCSPCHQATGMGIPGAFPQLVGDKVVLGSPAVLAGFVLNGKGNMPPFKTMLTDEQLAPILTYVRSAWGNAAPAVTTKVVAAARLAPPPAVTTATATTTTKTTSSKTTTKKATATP
jgi:cytochrome c6